MSSNSIYTTEYFIQRAKILHCDKYDYSKSEYINATTKLMIICPIHGDFLQSAHKHLSGGGCKSCGVISMVNKRKTGIDKFIIAAKLIHENKYDYSNSEYITSKTKLKIICNRCNKLFLQTPEKHLSGQGCDFCNRSEARLHPSEIFIDMCKNVHGDKYTYANIGYTGLLNKIEIFCNSCNKYFYINAGNHLYKKRDCKCYHKNKHISKISQKWLDSLNIPHLIREYTIPEYKLRRVDGYDPETNTIYQFHGTYWHSDPRKHHSNELHKRKKITHGQNYSQSCQKDQDLINLGYNLVIMWEMDFNISHQEYYTERVTSS